MCRGIPSKTKKLRVVQRRQDRLDFPRLRSKRTPIPVESGGFGSREAFHGTQGGRAGNRRESKTLPSRILSGEIRARELHDSYLECVVGDYRRDAKKKDRRAMGYPVVKFTKLTSALGISTAWRARCMCRAYIYDQVYMRVCVNARAR